MAETNKGDNGYTKRSMRANAMFRYPPDERLKHDDWRVLHLWRENLALLDRRYENKGLLRLVCLAMVNEHLRARLIRDPEGVLRDEESMTSDRLPDGVTVKFLDNTDDTLHVVLPPRTEEVFAKSPAMRELLRSRTEEPTWFEDDWDVGNLNPTDMIGDPDYKDDD